MKTSPLQERDDLRGVNDHIAVMIEKRRATALKKKVLSIMCLISCSVLLVGISVQANERNSYESQSEGDAMLEIYCDTYVSTPISESIHQEPCPHELISVP